MSKDVGEYEYQKRPPSDEKSQIVQRNWVFGTNWNFLIPISLEPGRVNNRYFKLRLFYLTEIIVWNI